MDDLIAAFLRLMATDDGVTGPFNLGNPHEIPVRVLAEQVIALTNSRSRIVHRKLPEDDPMQRCPDIARARDALGWEPHVALEQGLRRTIGYFEQLMSGQDGRPDRSVLPGASALAI